MPPDPITIPKTFSAPGSHEPSIDDRVRDAVFLALMADDANRKYYSYDDDNPDAGVRISAGFAHTRNRTYDVPQQLVQCVTGSNQLELLVQHDAIKRVSIAITHFEKPTTGKIEVNVLAPQMTPETLMGRTEEILMRGTLHVEGQVTAQGVLIDPYSPLLDDGTYDPPTIVRLNELIPTIQRQQPLPIKRSLALDDLLKEFDELDPTKDIAVLYTVVATYEINVADRDNLRNGGSS